MVTAIIIIYFNAARFEVEIQIQIHYSTGCAPHAAARTKFKDQ
jgi:hypothetical protein